MALDTPINRQLLINIFPDLAGDANFKILSEHTPIYNCIAWAMGYSDRWVDIYNSPGHWWPQGVERNMTPQALISAFEAEGFELSENCIPEEGYSKVVLYKNQITGEWTHAARIITSDVEHSKFGGLWDGQHSHDVLCNTTIDPQKSYGVAYAYMKKKEDTTPPTPVFSANISIDKDKLAQLKAMLSK